MEGQLTKIIMMIMIFDKYFQNDIWIIIFCYCYGKCGGFLLPAQPGGDLVFFKGDSDPDD
jgi:hypothetical protein